MSASVGKGQTMSAYGVQSYTSEERKEQWREGMKREDVFRKSHFVYKRFPGRELLNKGVSENLTYFNNNKKYKVESTYDRMFHIQHGYCCSIHRDDREHTQGLNVHAEEQNKKVPVLSSSVYGHRQPLEVPSRKHVRVGHVKRDFYRHCGTTIPTGD